MSFEYQTEKREFVRIHIDVPIRYKFLSRVVDIDDDAVYEGTTSNLSGAGLLLVGKLPSVSWIPGLLMGKILLGINLILPSLELPIKALCRVAWVEALEEGSEKCAMGLKFREITKENQDEIMKYIIKAQMTK